jgi:hypothetical protein
MRSILLTVAFVLVVTSCGCQGPEAKADSDPPFVSGPVATPRKPPNESASTTGEPSTEEATPCAAPIVVAPSALAVGWPGLLGRRVRLRVRATRALSFTEWFVVAEGVRFVVVAPPDTKWDRMRVFVVAPATTISAHGRTALPTLLLDDDCA